MNFSFNFKITYVIVTINKSKLLVEFSISTLSKKEIKRMLNLYKNKYKKSDGWKCSIAWRVNLAINNFEKEWLSKRYKYGSSLKNKRIESPFLPKEEIGYPFKYNF